MTGDGIAAPAPMAPRWWLPQVVPPGQVLRLHLGGFALEALRSSDAWLITAGSAPAGGARLELLDEPSGTEEAARFVFRDEHNRITLSPLLADRPMVIRPRQPTRIPPGETVTFHLATATWVAVMAGEPPISLCEFGTLRYSDTWIGPSTVAGEPGYALPTPADTRLEALSPGADRAITTLRVTNRAETPLALDKLVLPAPLLSVWGSGDGSLWTDTVHLERTADNDTAAVRIESGPPPAARNAQRLANPRRLPQKGSLVRAFSGLFHPPGR